MITCEKHIRYILSAVDESNLQNNIIYIYDISVPL